MTDLSDKMRTFAAGAVPPVVADQLREKANAFDAAVAQGDAKKILGAWARARRVWCDVTGESLI